MKQTVKDRAQQDKLLRTTGKSGVDNKLKYENMTSYLEDNSIQPMTPKAAQLSESEREAALKAISYYKSLSYTEIDQLISRSEVGKEQRKEEHKTKIKYAVLAAVAIATLTIVVVSIIL